MAINTKLNATTINTILMASVINTARVAVHQSDCEVGVKASWFNALDRAEIELATNPWFEFQDGVLLWQSATNGISYEVQQNGRHAGCKATEFGTPCYHRAVRKLLENYLAAVALPHIERVDLEPQTTVAASCPQPTASPKSVGAATVSPSERPQSCRYCAAVLTDKAIQLNGYWYCSSAHADVATWDCKPATVSPAVSVIQEGDTYRINEDGKIWGRFSTPAAAALVAASRRKTLAEDAEVQAEKAHIFDTLFPRQEPAKAVKTTARAIPPGVLVIKTDLGEMYGGMQI